MDRLAYTVAEVARALGVSRSHGYELVHRGLLPTITLGERILVPRAALLRHLDQLTRTTPAPTVPEAPIDPDATVAAWSWRCGCGTLTMTWTAVHHSG